MNPTQDRHTGSGSGRVPKQLYLDAGEWDRFEAVARAQNRSRSAQVRELIRRDIERHETEDRPPLEQAA